MLTKQVAERRMSFLNLSLVLGVFSLNTLSVVGCGPTPASGIVQGNGQSSSALGSVIAGPLAGVCYGLNMPIPFTATGAFLNSLVVKGGLIPMTLSTSMQTMLPGYPLLGNGTLDPWPLDGPTVNPYGAVILGGTPMAGMMLTTPPRVDGSLTMSVSSPALTSVGMMSGALVTGTVAAATGIIQVSPAKATLIAANNMSSMQVFPFQMTGNTLPMMPAYSQPCVTMVAFSMSYVRGSVFDGGRVFLYLNGTMHGSYLQF